ncbi:hypothetical protein JWG45_01670 [Leptospira sp. 201903070]|jgi:hypothetical protein|uniref:Cys-rich protein n=1 Tax=Leptospira ainlahdjerensis TaxID=2810033 RepID=A0ABS2U648_9LEPT|nr:hypothetical protein [Leptospira ainlahdjerensis]MBM9575850.1 hypothetical protein [Leptospira ainlahdjerensis]
MNLFRNTIVIGIYFLFLLSDYAQSGAPKDNCKTERETYCKDSRPGPEIHRCLKENESKLSDSCKAHLAEMETRHKAAKEACANDEQKFCKESSRENGGPIRCLKSHETELSAKCRDALPPLPDKR